MKEMWCIELIGGMKSRELCKVCSATKDCWCRLIDGGGFAAMLKRLEGVESLVAYVDDLVSRGH